MKLYVCFTTNGLNAHPCRKAWLELTKAGYEPEVENVGGIGFLPKPFRNTPGRNKVTELTGNHHVPTMVTNDGTIVDGSKAIVEWAQNNPAI